MKNYERALQITDDRIACHVNIEAWDHSDGVWVVCCEECGEILDYDIRLKDLDDDPWDCKVKQSLLELRELIVSLIPTEKKGKTLTDERTGNHSCTNGCWTPDYPTTVTSM